MRSDRFRRRARFSLLRLRALGPARIILSVALLAAAVSFHLTLAVSLADEQPGDSKVYEQFAANLLGHGVYSDDAAEPYEPTLIRMPGYPLFLAGVYRVAGSGNETAVRVFQALLYTLACLFAALTGALWTTRTRRLKTMLWVFVLTAFCPFMVIFSATILTEIPTIFLLSLTIFSATCAIKNTGRRASFVWWFAAGLFAGINVLFRPDAGLFAFGIGLTILLSALFGKDLLTRRSIDRVIKGVIFTIAFSLPLIPWTIRNEVVLGVFQPLAPTHAEKPGEFVPVGYYAWLRTWIDDSHFIAPMLWNLEIHPIQIKDIPADAFCSEEEKRRVTVLLDKYNNSDPEHVFPPPKTTASPEGGSDDNADADDDSANDNDDDSGDGDGDEDRSEWDLKISPEVDAEFAAIAKDRISRDPWRYYVYLPAKRAASMWFDTHSDSYSFNGELFPLTELDDDKGQQYWLPFFGGLDLIYTLLAAAGALLLLLKGRPSWLWFFLVMAVSLPRAVFFGTLENPEPRYLVELFLPASILGGLFLAHLRFQREKGSFGIRVEYSDDLRSKK